ncbi:MAG: hypothetical protein JW866_09220 [Ignavibacteriales bacterium]|nr:hypothetical protein [Ignavibacteriales bacterium]
MRINNNWDLECLKNCELEISKSILQLKSSKEGELPIIDGIIDPIKYSDSSFKILWILREARDEWVANKSTGKLSIGGWNLVKDAYKTATYDLVCKNITTRRELLIDYAILNNLCYSTEDMKKYSLIISREEQIKALNNFQSTAVINIKKFPGKITANIKRISEAYENTKHILITQIESYNPQIIICGNTLSLFEKELDFRNGTRFPLGIGKNGYYCLPNRIYINAYHPSYKYRRNTIYEHNYINSIIRAVENWRNNFYIET